MSIFRSYHSHVVFFFVDKAPFPEYPLYTRLFLMTYEIIHHHLQLIDTHLTLKKFHKLEDMSKKKIVDMPIVTHKVVRAITFVFLGIPFPS